MSIAALCLGLVRSLPPSPGILLSRFLVILYLALRPGYRRESLLNTRVFCGRCGRWFWVRNGWHVGRNLALMVQSGKALGNIIVDRAVIIGENYVRGVLEQELHATMASFHFGAWEYLPQVFRRLGHRVTVVAGVQKQEKLAQMLEGLRRTGGVRIVNSLKTLTGSLGRPGVLGFMLDNTSQGQRVWPESGSVRFGMPGLPFQLGSGLVPAFAYFAGGRLRVQVYPPGDEQDALKALVEQVRARPEEWVFWGKAGAVGGGCGLNTKTQARR